MNVRLYDALPVQITTSPYGAPRANGTTHKGRDSQAADGTPFYAAGSGVVMGYGENDAVYGRYLRVRYVLDDDRVVIILYGHLRRRDTADQHAGNWPTVTLGTQLGLTGGTAGSSGAGISTAPHLHEGVWVNGVLSNPDAILYNRSAAAGGGGIPIEGDDDVTLTLEQDQRLKNLEKALVVYPGNGIVSSRFAVHNTETGQPLGFDWLPHLNNVITTQGAQLTALTATVSALATAQGLNPEALATMIAARVDLALADNFAAIVAGQAEINANIDDSPTTFTVTATTPEETP